MKKKLLFLSAAIAVMGVSCTKSQDNFPVEGNHHSIVASVSHDSFTKAVFDTESKAISWELGDKIVVDGATYTRVGETSVFEYYSGGVTSTTALEGDAFYPVSLYNGGTGEESAKYTLPSNYIWNAETQKVDYVPMSGKVINYAVTFQPLTSIFKLTVNNNSGKAFKLCSITFTSSDQALGGDFIPVFNEVNTLAGIEFVAGGRQSKALTINVGGLGDITSPEMLENLVEVPAGDSYSLYLPFPAGEYSVLNARITAAVLQEDGSYKAQYSEVTKQTAESANLTCQIGKYYEISLNADTFQNGVAGAGTLDNPFIISNASDLSYIGGMVNSANEATRNYFRSACYKLNSDITLTSDWTETLGGASYSDTPFSGMIDGDGHSINLQGTNNSKPLFAVVKDAVIKNVVLNGDFTQSAEDSYGYFSPFFYEGQGRTSMVCVIYNGTVSTGKAAGTTVLSVFGAVKGNPFLAGAYSDSKMKSYDTSDYGPDDYCHLYAVLSSGSGTAPYSAYGVSAKISPIEENWYYVHGENINTPDVEPYNSTPTADDVVAELNAAIASWNFDLKFNPSISESDFAKLSTSFKYKNDNGTLSLSDDNE
ncbi:MAG: hypothetical protein MJY61_04740 [Bacteroidales bacterium]|nr:hypothetical protein [Bacteroidales bacterium]